jgi:hypothetical protein
MTERFESPIRDLIRKLREIAQGHAAFSQVNTILSNAYDHMACIARLEEINHAQHARPRGALVCLMCDGPIKFVELSTGPAGPPTEDDNGEVSSEESKDHESRRTHAAT